MARLAGIKRPGKDRLQDSLDNSPLQQVLAIAFQRWPALMIPQVRIDWCLDTQTGRVIAGENSARDSPGHSSTSRCRRCGLAYTLINRCWSSR